MHGYHQRYLRVDVTDGTARSLPLEESVLRRFLGGSGLGTWLLHQEAPVGCGPLSPESPLIFCFSPL
jgi:aldehyde:ferredoxin oxidoreductase